MKSHALVDLLRGKTRPPLAVVLGSPGETAELLAALGAADAVCYQMDLYQADRLRQELETRGVSARVVTTPDLWDLPGEFQSALYPVPQAGERSLKIDMVEQAFHILRPGGQLLVLSPYDRDQLFPNLLKKVFGRVHHAPAGKGTLFWCYREGDRPRRRHEMTFHARIGAGPSLCFRSRPGVFSYGRFDDGARALVETMHVETGDRVLDLGCGCGTNGAFAGQRSGPSGWVTFLDSNVRAVALAEINARANGLAAFQTLASAAVAGVPAGSQNVILANPPYYAQGTIARRFIEQAGVLLQPGGRFYLVTKQPDQIGPVLAEHLGRAEVVERRGYVVLCARAPGTAGRARADGAGTGVASE